MTWSWENSFSKERAAECLIVILQRAFCSPKQDNTCFISCIY